MARRNAYKRIAENICGSRAAWRGLPPEERQEVLDTARQMYDLGVNAPAAERAELLDKRGFVYVITNPAWPGIVKIGRAFDPESRLAGYQTSCPHRDYELHSSVYFHDCYFAEKEIHARLIDHCTAGEWFIINPDHALGEINRLREEI
jgi:hypothetical protein